MLRSAYQIYFDFCWDSDEIHIQKLITIVNQARKEAIEAAAEIAYNTHAGKLMADDAKGKILSLINELK